MLHSSGPRQAASRERDFGGRHYSVVEVVPDCPDGQALQGSDTDTAAERVSPSPERPPVGRRDSQVRAGSSRASALTQMPLAANPVRSSPALPSVVDQMEGRTKKVRDRSASAFGGRPFSEESLRVTDRTGRRPYAAFTSTVSLRPAARIWSWSASLTS